MTPLGRQPSWLRIVFVVLLFSVTILAVALAVLFYFGGKHGQAKFVDKGKYQAVFLESGQVYFGQVKDMNDEYINLLDIYYLNTDNGEEANKADTTDASALQLKKLGCELHRPTDQMLINRDHVTFWENISDKGDVATAISKWKKDNPNGQTCTAATDSTQPTGTGADETPAQ